MHEYVPDNPARGKAQGRIDGWSRDHASDRRRERSPEVDATRIR
jgi:hypothetical protein